MARGNFNAVSILQFQDLVSVQVVFHEQSFCPKGSVGISSINAGEQAELSWPNYAFNWIAKLLPVQEDFHRKKSKQKIIHDIHFYWNDFLSHLYFI